MKPIIQLLNPPNRGPTRAPLRGWWGCPLWAFSQELKEEGSHPLRLRGCNVQMARCVRGTLQQSQLSSTSALHRPRPGSHTGLVKRKGGRGSGWTWRCFTDKICVQVSEKHQPHKKFILIQPEIRKRCQRHIQRYVWICQWVCVRQDWQIHKYKNCYTISKALLSDWNYPKQR